MKRVLPLFLIVSLLACFCLQFSAAAEDPGYTITDYHFEGTLQANNVMHVRETLDVDFNEPSHGIIRSVSNIITFDTSLYGGDAVYRYKAEIENLSVKGAPFTKSDTTDYTNIRIGDKNRTVTGRQQYIITYNYVMPDDRLTDYDFIFYSVLGSEVTAQVEHFSFYVTFEKPLPDDTVQNFRLFSGRFGSIYNTRDVVYTADASHAEGEAASLRPGDAITLFAPIEGVYFVNARKPSVIPGMLFSALSIALGLFYLFKALLTPHDRTRATAVEFYPPAGISSAEAGYILSGNVTDTIMLSLIPYWAGKGYLTVEESEGEKIFLTLTKVTDLPASAPEYERTLFNAMFKPGVRDTFVCETDSGYSFVTQLDKAKNQLAGLFKGERALLQNVRTAKIAVIAVNLAYFLLLTFCGAISLVDNATCGLYSLFTLGTIGSWSVRRNCKFRRNAGETVVFAIVSILLIVIAAFGSYVCASEDCLFPPAVIFASFVPVALFNLFAGRMICQTAYSRSVTEKLEGFRNFIKTAELSRLNLLMHDNPVYYYDIVPYAMAFDLMDSWAGHFETFTPEQPYWYYCNMHSWDYHHMKTAMFSGLSRPVSHTRSTHAASSSSSSSSGGGGGYSGGGGGGGGVSRW